MKFNIITLFPNFFNSPLNTSILKKAIEKKLIEVDIINLRDFTKYKHKQCDDKPYGGGYGMVLMIEPVYEALKYVREKDKNTYVIYPSPQGRIFNQEYAKKLVNEKDNITFLCGHYEGIDNRIVENLIDEEISLGDYILTGGEAASLVFVEVLARLVPEVVQRKESVETDSFEKDLLKYPQYTKPRKFRGMKVPDVLLSGNHQKIAEWRKKMQIKITKEKRPDLYKKFLKRSKENE